MIKYIKQRYSNPNEKEQESQTPQQSSHNPEIIENYSTVALRNLKQAQDHVDSMKRRLSVLQIRQDKTIKKIEQSQRKLDFHSRVQYSIAQQKMRKSNFLKKMEKQLQRSRSRIKVQRQTHDNNIKNVQQDLSANKRADYQKIKQTSQYIDNSIKQLKKNEQNQNLRRKNQIKNMEQNQRKHVAEYFLQKRANFRQSSVRQGSSYNSRRYERQKILEQLSQAESRMVQRQSASRVVLEDTYKKLQRITVNQAKNKTKSTRQKSTDALSQKLPPLTFRNQDDYILL